MNPLKDAGVEAVLKAAEKHPNLHLLSIEVRRLHTLVDVFPLVTFLSNISSTMGSLICHEKTCFNP